MIQGETMKTLIIIPAYNEALNIEKTMEDVKKNAQEYDYLIINDCSKDNTKAICEKNKYHFLSLPVNYGLASGIQVGMKYAAEHDYDIAIQFDGDGQHKAQYIKDLVKEIEEGADIAIGSRFVEKKKNFSIRMLGSTIITFIIKVLTGKKIKDPTSGMRAYNKKCIHELVVNMNLPPEPDTLVYMMKNGMQVKEVQVEMVEREFGESYLNAWKSVEYMINVLISILFIKSFGKSKNKKSK